jgi:hypothetical protein
MNRELAWNSMKPKKYEFHYRRLFSTSGGKFHLVEGNSKEHLNPRNIHTFNLGQLPLRIQNSKDFVLLHRK